jgi:hypothetical protein
MARLGVGLGCSIVLGKGWRWRWSGRSPPPLLGARAGPLAMPQFARMLRCSQATRTHGVASSRPAREVKGRGGAAGWRRGQPEEERPWPIEAGRGGGTNPLRHEIFNQIFLIPPHIAGTEENGRPWFSDRKTGLNGIHENLHEQNGKRRKVPHLLSIWHGRDGITGVHRYRPRTERQSYTYQR